MVKYLIFSAYDLYKLNYNRISNELFLSLDQFLK
jgi:hypothetical protein